MKDGFNAAPGASGPVPPSSLNVSQKKKVIFKRETDAQFGFLKIDTVVKAESRLKMRRMLKANIMGNTFDLSEKFTRVC